MRTTAVRTGEARNIALMNGGLIGFGLGFALASLALYRVVSGYFPAYAKTWYFQGIAIIGGIGLAIGIGFEAFERVKNRKTTRRRVQRKSPT
jgi:heme/copper-type cytochrome/quinol oxidase subunit 4